MGELSAGGQVTLVDNQAVGQYELRLDGRRVGLLSYHDRDGVLVLAHTETLPEFGGRGLAGRLVGFALDDLQARGRLVDPACPFVRAFIDKHPEYQDLIAHQG
ncbi:MAG: GNAT family N-acetyltransferase [Jatrophihabitans sp.]